MIRQAKKHFYENQLKKYKGDVKNTWGIMNSLMGKTKSETPSYPRYIYKDNELIQDKKEISNIFNEYFVSIGSNLANQIQHTGNTSYREYLTSPLKV